MTIIRLFSLATLSLAAFATLAGVNAQEDQAADNAQTAVSDPVAYFLGLSVGQQMRQNGFRPDDFDLDQLLSGFADGLNKRESALSDEELKVTQGKIQDLLRARQKTMLAESKQEGDQFLAANAKKDGVKELKGGVQYKVIQAGDGESPEPTDTVKVHYTGKLIDGTMFDSSVQRGQPATFRVEQVIKGWQMALQAMKVGDKWMLYIPSNLAYGEAGSPPAIAPNQVLVFEVELLAIQ